MRKTLLLSAALLAVLAGPALAQRGDDDHGRGNSERGGRPAAAAPATAPRQAAPAQHAAPAAQAAPQPGSRADAGRQSMQREQAQRQQFQNRDRNAVAQGNNRPDANRSGNNNRPNVNRGNNGNNGRTAGRTNWSQYHQAFNAPQRFHYRGNYVRPSGWYARRWSYGDFLPSLFWSSNYWINDFGYYDLPPPPPGAVWVRDGADALLIDRYTGEIIEVEYGIFY